MECSVNFKKLYCKLTKLKRWAISVDFRWKKEDECFSWMNQREKSVCLDGRLLALFYTIQYKPLLSDSNWKLARVCHVLNFNNNSIIFFLFAASDKASHCRRWTAAALLRVKREHCEHCWYLLKVTSFKAYCDLIFICMHHDECHLNLFEKCFEKKNNEKQKWHSCRPLSYQL